MVREKEAKIATLAVSAVILIIYAFDVDVAKYGIFAGAGVGQRVVYHFFHSSFLHAVLNAWCLLSVVFVFDVSLSLFITAFFTASLFPVDTLYHLMPLSSLEVPTVGLSGVCYALMGMMAFRVQRKLYYQAWLAFYIGLGFLFPNVNGWIHLYCYVAGLLIGLLNKPIR